LVFLEPSGNPGPKGGYDPSTADVPKSWPTIKEIPGKRRIRFWRQLFAFGNFRLDIFFVATMTTWSQSYDRELQRQRCKYSQRQRCM
jgi:hypothetical protein